MNSYQKLKAKLAEKEQEINRLREMIYKNDQMKLLEVRLEMGVVKNIEKVLWEGGPISYETRSL